MPAAFNEIGVKCVTAALVESVDVQKQLEHKIIKKNDGAFETGKASAFEWSKIQMPAKQSTQIFRRDVRGFCQRGQGNG